jgi:GGDEF domain-containing protein
MGQLPSTSLIDLDRRSVHLTIFSCLAIFILSAGLALLMYPAVFANQAVSPGKTPQIAYFGFCGLSCLLTAYIVERQITIQRLRRQIALDRLRASDALSQASADLLATMPNFNTFGDRLSMEFRRAVTASLNLSVFVVALKLRSTFSEPGLSVPALSDAAKVISRRLREQDSIYLLKSGYFGVILPGVDTLTARRISDRLCEGLSDAAGATDRFSFEISTINYPEHAKSLHDFDLAVCEYLPDSDPKQNQPKGTYTFR